MMAEQVRRQHMDWLVKMLKSAEPPIKTKKFIAVSAYNQAVSVTKIREYLDLLKDMEVLIEEGEEMQWIGWEAEPQDSGVLNVGISG